MTTALLAPLVYCASKNRAVLTNPVKITVSLLVGGLLSPIAVSLHSRVYEARFVESSPVID